MGILKKIHTVAKNHTTYQVGLLQTKAYRALKGHTDAALESSGITSVHWALLGLLRDNPSNFRASDAAMELDVEAPFVTRMLAELTKKKLVESSQDPRDNRAKIVCLTKMGKKFVDETERMLRSAVRPLILGVSAGELADYLVVLEKIIKNKKDHTQ